MKQGDTSILLKINQAGEVTNGIRDPMYHLQYESLRYHLARTKHSPEHRKTHDHWKHYVPESTNSVGMPKHKRRIAPCMHAASVSEELDSSTSVSWISSGFMN